MSDRLLIGPFEQILTMRDLRPSGPLNDEDLEILENRWILISQDTIEDFPASPFEVNGEFRLMELSEKSIALPGFVDCHTHICYGGSRAKDYSMRLSGKSYQEIAKAGGGIVSTVENTRKTNSYDLFELAKERLEQMMKNGVTTCEIKSGYGLDLPNELKMLKVIERLNNELPASVVSTFLGAHIKAPEFDNHGKYLEYLSKEVLPEIKFLNLSKRVDIFVEEGAFDLNLARKYLEDAKQQGFTLTVHADQFSTGGAKLAAELGALSADHLEVSTDEDIMAMQLAGVIPVVLPGASLGLGIDFAPARKILDMNLPLVIASDYNPGSAPMGELLTQASLLAIYEKLTMAETIAAITSRAVKALGYSMRGILSEGYLADINIFEIDDYREILYSQGRIKPSSLIKEGIKIEFDQ